MKRPQITQRPCSYAACAALSRKTAAADWIPPPQAWLEVLWLTANEVEVFVLIFVFVIIVIKVAEAGGEGGCRQNGGGSGLRVAVLVDLHAEGQAHLREDLFDLVQGLAAEVLGLQHLGFGLLDELADGGDVGVLEAVVAADGELKLFDRAVEVLVAQRRAVVQPS